MILYNPPDQTNLMNTNCHYRTFPKSEIKDVRKLDGRVLCFSITWPQTPEISILGQRRWVVETPEFLTLRLGMKGGTSHYHYSKQGLSRTLSIHPTRTSFLNLLTSLRQGRGPHRSQIKRDDGEYETQITMGNHKHTPSCFLYGKK